MEIEHNEKDKSYIKNFFDQIFQKLKFIYNDFILPIIIKIKGKPLESRSAGFSTQNINTSSNLGTGQVQDPKISEEELPLEFKRRETSGELAQTLSAAAGLKKSDELQRLFANELGEGGELDGQSMLFTIDTTPDRKVDISSWLEAQTDTESSEQEQKTMIITQDMDMVITKLHSSETLRNKLINILGERFVYGLMGAINENRTLERDEEQEEVAEDDYEYDTQTDQIDPENTNFENELPANSEQTGTGEGVAETGEKEEEKPQENHGTSKNYYYDEKLDKELEELGKELEKLDKELEELGIDITDSGSDSGESVEELERQIKELLEE